MTDLDTYADSTNPQAVPKGWEPYAEEVGSIGSAITRLPRPNATERDLLISAGFNPDNWCIDGDINVRRWMRYDQEFLYYYKFNVKAGESEEAKQLDIEDMLKSIRRRKPADKTVSTSGDAWAFFMSDLQIGKREGDIGTDQIVERYLRGVDKAVGRVKELRKMGREIKHGAVIGLGDIVESCSGFYASQPFVTDRNYRDQYRISRELIYHTIDTLEPLFDEFTVACVGGNHGTGHARNDSNKITTDDADNMDVAVFESVREAYDRSGKSLNWVIPHDQLSVGLTLGGVSVGITHGHLFRKGTTAQAKALDWWKGQVFGFQPVADCKILVSGHFHHMSWVQAGGRTLVQAPACDPGSKWYSDSTGEVSGPGILTMRFDSSIPTGLDDVSVLEVL